MDNSKTSLTIYISGLYSGPNPSPGVGIARSLRMAYPDSILVGIDYSNRSSGLHWGDFDKIWLQRPWDELNLNEYVVQIGNRLTSGDVFFVSGLDLETRWLSSLGLHNAFVPPFSAIRRVTKPDIFTGSLPISVPPFLFFSEGEEQLYKFCTQYGWPIWVKGPWYEAVLAYNWLDVQKASVRLASTWSTDQIFLQKHIIGREVSIAFAAYRGKLLGSAYMQKRDVTPEGKTWAGRISSIVSELAAPLEKVAAQLEWTGGAEIECVKDTNNVLWLIDWNPRFPAWIHGATLAGHNLPARLIAAASGMRIKEQRLSHEFTRVVIEIPVKPDFPLPPLPERSMPVAFVGKPGFKHPSGMPILAKKLKSQINSSKKEKEAIQERFTGLGEIIKAVSSAKVRSLETPAWIFFESMAYSRFKSIYSISQALNKKIPIDIHVAYSIKTNPDRRLLALAQHFSFLAEAISQREVETALYSGFQTEQVVLNGPGKWWPYDKPRYGPLHVAFCDSLEELERIMKMGLQNVAQMIGVRIRPPQYPSRFGIPVESFTHFSDLISLVKQLPKQTRLALHFHVQSSVTGIPFWEEISKSVLYWGNTIETLTDRKIVMLDFGGGFVPNTLEMELSFISEKMISYILQQLPSVQELIFEPGKSLVQDTMALVTRVLEVRRRGENVTIVVDGSIAEMSNIDLHPHRILWFSSSGEARLLERGEDLIVGRLCMENDILGRVSLPAEISEGDIVLFLDVGAYDRSMSHDFGKG